MMRKLSKSSLLFSIAMLLVACGTHQKSMYYWKDYNNAVYNYLKNDNTSLGEQINQMKSYFDNAQKEQYAVAPGAHAHMGLLLFKTGQINEARQQFLEEKKLFPESSSYIDFLMKNKANGDKK